MTIRRKMKNLLLAAAAMTMGTSALAQLTDFPEGAEPLAPEALRAALVDKVFSITPAKGPAWRWEFKDNGYFFLNAGSFYNSGKWSTKDSSLCQDSGKTMGCNPMRQKDGVLYIKRDSGETLAFKPQ